MKLRTGFVSNSSSTSFCIYGTTIEGKGSDFDFQRKIEELKLDCHASDQESDDLFVGGSLENCRDDQTMGEFKKEVEKKLKKLLKDGKFECATRQDGWYNG